MEVDFSTHLWNSVNDNQCSSIHSTLFVEARKKKKKKPKKSKKSDFDNPERRPEAISPSKFCAICRAIVKELKDLKGEAEVYDFMSTVWDAKRYYIYDYPPEMVESCVAFIQSWEEEIEKAFLNRDNNYELEQTLWYDVTKAWVGVHEQEMPKDQQRCILMDRAMELEKTELSICKLMICKHL